MGPEILFVSVIVAAVGALSASRQSGRDILVAWRRGHAALAAGRSEEAEECFRETLRIAEQRYGPDHWRTALHVNALAQALLAQKRIDDAARSVDRAVGIVERWSPVPHPEIANVLAGAALFESTRGRHGRAVPLLEKARVAAGHDPTLRAAVERTLARVESNAGREAEAADAFTRIPPERLEPADARWLASFGAARLRQGDPERAVRCFATAHALVERESPGEFAEAFYLGLLGEALARCGRDAEALQALEQTIIDYDAVVGDRHPATARPLVDLAEVRMRLGDLAGARLACERVLALRLPRSRTSQEPYRAMADLDDPLGAERERAAALLARAGRRAG